MRLVFTGRGPSGNGLSLASFEILTLGNGTTPPYGPMPSGIPGVTAGQGGLNRATAVLPPAAFVTYNNTPGLYGIFSEISAFGSLTPIINFQTGATTQWSFGSVAAVGWSQADINRIFVTDAEVAGINYGYFTYTPLNSFTRLGRVLVEATVAPPTLQRAPTAVGAEMGLRQARVSWQAPATIPGVTRSGYGLELSTDGGRTWAPCGSTSKDVTALTISGLDLGVPYSFRVAEITGSGTVAFSEPTPQQFATGSPALPGAPTIGTASNAGGGRVTLTWTKPTNTGNLPITDYLLEASTDNGTTWAPIVEGASSNESASIPDLSPGTYVFRVRAANVMGLGDSSAPSSPLTLTATLPAVPMIGSITAGDAQATVRWTPGSGGTAITSFTIEQSSDGGRTWQTSVVDAVPSGSATSATVKQLINGAAYTFRVKAVGAGGTSAASMSSASVTPRLSTAIVAGRVREDSRGEVAAGIKVGTAMSAVTIFVNPVAPRFTTSPNANQTATEGAAAAVSLGAFTGPAGDGTSSDGTEWKVDVRWWTGTTIDPINATSFTAFRDTMLSRSLTFPRAGTWTVEVTVTDNDAQTVVRTFTVEVAPAPQTADIGRMVGGVFESLAGPISIQETSSLDLVGRVTKPGLGTVSPRKQEWSVTKNGALFASSNSAIFRLVPDDDGTYVVMFRAQDANAQNDTDLWSAWDSLTVTVTHVAPTAAMTIQVPTQAGDIAATAVPQGTPLLLSAIATPAMPADTITSYVWTIARAGGSTPATGTGATFAFTPQVAGDYTITLTATDSDGQSTTRQRSVTVTNASPTIAGPIAGLPAAPVAEGTPVTLSVTASDLGDALIYAWSVTRNGLSYNLGGVSPTASTLTFTPADDGNYAVTVSVSDGKGGTATASGSFGVVNAAPTAALTTDKSTAAGMTVNQGDTLTVAVAATDVPADAASLRYSFDLDDDGIWEVENASSPSFISPTLTTTGARTLRARVADKDGGEATRLLSFTVANTAPTVTSLKKPDTGPSPRDDGSAPLVTTTGGIALTGAFTDPGSAAETYRGTATIQRTDAAGTSVTLPLLIRADGTFDVAYALPTAGRYSVTASLMDSSGSIGQRSVNVVSLGLGLSGLSLAENAGANAEVGTLSLNPDDPTVVYSIVAGEGDNDNDRFIIVGSKLRARASLDFETTGQLSVRIAATSPLYGTIQRVFALTVTDVNEAPSAVRLTDTVTSLSESIGTAMRIRLADIAVSDDALGTATLSLAGPDAASFEIVAASLYLKAGVSLDARLKPAYSVTVQAEDATLAGSAPATSVFALTITSTANQAPTGITLANAVTSLAESTSTATRTKLADIVVADDGRGTNAITLGGPDVAAFEVVGTALYLKAGVPLNFEAKTTYAVTVSAGDSSVAGSVPVTATFTLAITDTNEAPTDLTLSPASVAENAPIGSPVGVLTATDPDAGSTFTFTMVEGTGSADNAWFEIAGSALRTKAVFDYETRSSYSIRVQATDAGGLSFEKPLTITITNVNEPPTAVALSLPDSTPTGASVKLADIAVIDDGLGSNVLTLSGADAASFQIIGAALYLKAGTTLNVQTKPTYIVAVSVADPSLPESPPATTTYTLTILPTGIVVAPGVSIVDSITRTGSDRIVKQGAGTLILDKANSHSGGTVVEAGTLIVQNPAALGTGAVVVKPGATLVIDAAAGTALAGSLSIETGGRIDLGTGSITVTSGLSPEAITGMITAARGNGFWTEPVGLGSSAVAEAIARGVPRAIGWLKNGDGSFTIGFAAPGDSNLDALVDVIDAANFLAGGKYDAATIASWTEGDYNFDGMLDILDTADFLGTGLFDAGFYGAAPLAAAETAQLVSASDSTADSSSSPTSTSTSDLAFAALAAQQDEKAAKKRKVFATFP